MAPRDPRPSPSAELPVRVDRLAARVRAAREGSDEGLAEVLAELRGLTVADRADLPGGLAQVCARGSDVVEACLTRGPGGRHEAGEELLGWLDQLVVYAREVCSSLDGAPGGRRPESEPEPEDGGERLVVPQAVRHDECTPDYLEEAEERLDQAEQALLELEEHERDLGLVNAAFRSFHTIKGMAGFLAFEPAVRLAHAAEEVLNAAREGTISLAHGHVELLLSASRLLHELNDAVSGAPAPELRRHTELCDALRRAAAGEDPSSLSCGAAAPSHLGGPAPDGAESGEPGSGPPRLGELLLQRGLLTPRALELALAEQRETGRRLGQTLVELGLVTEDDIRLSLRAQRASATERSFDRLPLGELLVHLGILTPRALAATLREQRLTGKRLGETLVDLGLVASAEIDRALALQAAGSESQRSALGVDPEVLLRELSERIAAEGEDELLMTEEVPPSGASGTLKVDAERLDEFVDLFAELLVAHRALLRHGEMRRLEGGSFAADLHALGTRLRHANEAALTLRMAPLEATFRRLGLLARETAGRLGKEVRIQLEGERIELDRALVEDLADPLAHLVRNAVDHGLEGPDARRAAGKPETGELRILARLRGAEIVVEIVDDGAGIDATRVVARARSLGLLGPSFDPAAVDPGDLLNLIALPGFSTREEASDVSGRGVGMDVVHREVERHGGRLRIGSEPGRGTRFEISLPLHLATVETLSLRAGGHTACVPAGQLASGEGLRAAEIRTLPDGTEVVPWDGALVPLVRLARLVDPAAPADGLELAALASESGRVVLLADAVLDCERRVIRCGACEVPGAVGSAALGAGAGAPLFEAGALLKELRENRIA